MFFTDRGKAAVTFDSNATSITGCSTYNRFTKGNMFREKAYSIITANTNKITRNSRFK